MTSRDRRDGDAPATDARESNRPRRRSSRRRASGRRIPRLPILLVVIAAVVAAVVVGTATPEPDPVAAVTPAAEVVEGRPATTWYCAAGSSDAEGFADETVVIGNIGDEDADVTVRVERGDEGEPVSEQFDVPAQSQERVLISDLVESAAPGVVVEAFGGTVVVDHLLRGADDVAGGSCATDTSTTWYFAAGTTTADTAQFLDLFNPFGNDAILDVTLFTSEGVKPDRSLEGLVVPRHSKVSVAVHSAVPRQDIVALGVEARAGRVVAERTTVYLGNQKPAGLGVSLGAVEPSTDWTVVNGRLGSGASEAIVVLNPGDITAEIEVAVVADGDTLVEPQFLSVPSRSVAALDVAGLPAEEDHTIRVRSVNDQPVVVDQRWVFRAPDSAIGLATTEGITDPTERWAFAYAGVDDTSADRLIVFNPAVLGEGDAVTVSATLFRGGSVQPLQAADLDAVDLDVTDVVVEPGERLTVKLGDVPGLSSAALTLEASGPVVTSLVSFPAGVATTPGVPVR